MDAVTRGSAGNGFGVAGVDAKFVMEDGSANTFGGEGVPKLVDNGSEAVSVVGVEVCWKFYVFVEFGLMFGGIPEDAVGAIDGEVEQTM